MSGEPETLRRLPLREEHLAAGARMAPFAGWEMPLQYAGIVAEHEAVRGDAGVFDVSHMGRVMLDGPGAGERLRAITTFDVTSLAPGEAHYSLYCTPSGGIADDVFVYRLALERWLIVHNAANAEADYARVAEAIPDAFDVTEGTVMLAVQGPRALERLRDALGAAGRSLDALEPRHCVEVEWEGGVVLVARTGYTGEDGAECVLSPAWGQRLWTRLVTGGVAPAGLGARDTLRLEAALPLHGHDISEETNPFEAGLGWVVTLDDGAPFTGRDALERLRAAGPARRLACLRLLERGVPRDGYAVLDGASGDEVGVLTSGTFSPTLRTGIGMAYLPPRLAKPGTRLAVQVRDRALAAEVVRRPFYRRAE